MELDRDNLVSGLDGALRRLYGKSAPELEKQVARYSRLAEDFRRRFGTDPATFFSAPGRAEITGNHTDHNGGEVLAASIHLDAVAAAAPQLAGTREAPQIRLVSEGFPGPFVVDLLDLSPRPGETGTAALIRGIAAGFAESGFAIGGFSACMSSVIPSGSGLSSSAAIEMLVNVILNDFYNGGAIEPLALAKIGQYAENRYWNKQSGLLDQLACGTGGLIHLDFRCPDAPLIRPVDYDLGGQGYAFLIVQTGGDHSDLSQAYSEVPAEMRRVAAHFGKQRCIDVSREEVRREIDALRHSAGDRAILRALHFFGENERVRRQVSLLARSDFSGFLDVVNSSGSSSWRLLQNGYDVSHPRSQAIPLAQALTELFLEKMGVAGAFRVHGGGFAGTSLTILPEELVPDYVEWMAPTFGEDALIRLFIRAYGSVNVSFLL